MIKKLRRVIISVTLGVLITLSICNPVLAIGNPDTIDFTSQSIDRYRAFTDVYETGDMLFLIETYVHYVVPPTDYTGSEAFTFQVLNAAGDTVLIQTPIMDFENNMVGIYQTAAQVTAAGYTSGTAYKFRIAGNATIFGAPNEGVNCRTVTLVASDWVDQDLNSEELTSPLRLFVLLIIEDIETEETATHTVTIQGISYLDASGSTIALEGVPSLNVFVPELFQTQVSPMLAPDPAHTGAYQAALTPTNMLGATIATSVSGLSTWLGVSTTMAGIFITALFLMILMPVLFQVTQNGKISFTIGALFVALCSYLGLFPIAMLFIIGAIILMLVLFLFWGRSVGI